MNRIKIKIRNAKFKDIKEIKALIAMFPQELLQRSLYYIAQNIDRYLIATVNDEIVGVVSWQILPDVEPLQTNMIEIISLVVHPNYQRKGIGSRLLKHVLKKVKNLSPDKIVVLTFTPEFFEKFGFTRIPKQSILRKIFVDCANCTKYDSPLTCPEIAMVYHPGE